MEVKVNQEAPPSAPSETQAQTAVAAPLGKSSYSGPLTMLTRPSTLPIDGHVADRFQGELEEPFDSVARRVALPVPRGLIDRLRSILPGYTSGAPHRTVAFDGFRTDLYDDKLERDRRYGTVYSVDERENAYLVTLEMPRQLPESSLQELWGLSEMPDYVYSLHLEPSALSIRAGLPRESFRRLSYVSASFPSDFLTRIEFRRRVSGFVHRLRNKNLEVIVLTASNSHRAT
jgi:hypothetical protein